MLRVLHEVVAQLPDLMGQPEEWSSKFIDYTPPIVERLYRPWRNCRINLHRIHPCTEAFFHPHPWPSAVRVLTGSYEMGVGFGKGITSPAVAARVILVPGAEYEMDHPDGWHWVRPIGEPSLSVMITGVPWKARDGEPRPMPEAPHQRLRELTPDERDRLFLDVKATLGTG